MLSAAADPSLNGWRVANDVCEWMMAKTNSISTRLTRAANKISGKCINWNQTISKEKKTPKAPTGGHRCRKPTLVWVKVTGEFTLG